MRYKTTIVYQRNKEFEGVDFPKDWRIENANPRYFAFPEDNTKIVVTNREDIKEAYRKLGVDIYDLNKTTGELEKEVSEEEIEDEQEVSISEVEENEPESVDTGFSLDSYFEESSKEEVSEDANSEEDYSYVEDEVNEEFLPQDWRDYKWLELRTLAKKYTDDTVRNKEHAIEILEDVESKQKQ